MKVSFSTKNISIILLVIIIFVALNLTGFAKEVKNFFYVISAPVQKVFWQAGEGASDFLGSLFRAQDLEKTVEELRLENQGLLSQIASLKELKKENETLREALNIGLEKDYQLELAQVIGKDISQDSILINKGKKDGVFKGLPVISQQKVVLGMIGTVYKDFSEVVLISHKDSSFDAKISEKEIFGLARGKGNLQLLFDLIPKEEIVAEGDLVVTTALGGIFPQGLLVGKVREVESSDLDPFKTAILKPSFVLQDLDYLFIITEF